MRKISFVIIHIPDNAIQETSKAEGTEGSEMSENSQLLASHGQGWRQVNERIVKFTNQTLNFLLIQETTKSSLGENPPFLRELLEAGSLRWCDHWEKNPWTVWKNGENEKRKVRECTVSCTV